MNPDVDPTPGLAVGTAGATATDNTKPPSDTGFKLCILPTELLLFSYSLTNPRSTLPLTCQSTLSTVRSGSSVPRAWFMHMILTSTRAIPISIDGDGNSDFSSSSRKVKTHPRLVSRFSSFLQYRLALNSSRASSADLEVCLLEYLYSPSGPYSTAADFDLTHTVATHLANARFQHRSLTYLLPHRAWTLYPDAFHLALYFVLAGNTPQFQRALHLLAARLPDVLTRPEPISTWLFLMGIDTRAFMQGYYDRMRRAVDSPVNAVEPIAWTFVTLCGVLAAVDWNLGAIEAVADVVGVSVAEVVQGVVLASAQVQAGEDPEEDNVMWPLGRECVTRAMKHASGGGREAVRLWMWLGTNGMADGLGGAVFPMCLYALGGNGGGGGGDGQFELFKYLFETLDAPTLVSSIEEVGDAEEDTSGRGHQARAIGHAIVEFAIDKRVAVARTELVPRAFELGLVGTKARAKVLVYALADVADEQERHVLVDSVKKSTDKWYGLFVDALEYLASTHPSPTPQALAALLDFMATTTPFPNSPEPFNTTKLLTSCTSSWPWSRLLLLIHALPLLAHPIDIQAYLPAVLTWIQAGHEQPAQVAGKRLFAVYLLVHLLQSSPLEPIDALVQRHVAWPHGVGVVYVSCLEHVVRKSGRVLPDIPEPRRQEAVFMFDEVVDAIGLMVEGRAPGAPDGRLVPQGYRDIVLPRLGRQGAEVLDRALSSTQGSAGVGRSAEELARLTNALDKLQTLEKMMAEVLCQRNGC